MSRPKFTKEPATIEAQLNKLEFRGCIIEDRDYATGVLEKINYYRLANYFEIFQENSKRYLAGTSFSRVVRIYDFDRRLRGLLLIFLEEIEISMRAVISNFHALKYGALGYINDSTFSHHHNHNHFMSRLNRLVETNTERGFVSHYNRKHSGSFPLWVMMELFSFGMLAHFFKSLHKHDRKEIVERHFEGRFNAGHLESWLESMAALRNHCAHYARLYANIIEPKPKELLESGGKPLPFRMSGCMFSFIYVIRLLYIKREGGESNLALQLGTLFEEFGDVIDLSVMGFPGDWEEVLV
jgi:abortive infection bacteriophage resistance protein